MENQQEFVIKTPIKKRGALFHHLPATEFVLPEFCYYRSLLLPEFVLPEFGTVGGLTQGCNGLRSLIKIPILKRKELSIRAYDRMALIGQYTVIKVCNHGAQVQSLIVNLLKFVQGLLFASDEGVYT